jgi:hypothetical protein
MTAARLSRSRPAAPRIRQACARASGPASAIARVWIGPVGLAGAVTLRLQARPAAAARARARPPRSGGRLARMVRALAPDPWHFSALMTTITFSAESRQFANGKKLRCLFVFDVGFFVAQTKSQKKLGAPRKGSASIKKSPPPGVSYGEFCFLASPCSPEFYGLEIKSHTVCRSTSPRSPRFF